MSQFLRLPCLPSAFYPSFLLVFASAEYSKFQTAALLLMGKTKSQLESFTRNEEQFLKKKKRSYKLSYGHELLKSRGIFYYIHKVDLCSSGFLKHFSADALRLCNVERLKREIPKNSAALLVVFNLFSLSFL